MKSEHDVHFYLPSNTLITGMTYPAFLIFLCVFHFTFYSNLQAKPIRNNPAETLHMIHSKLKFFHGSLMEEYPEQLMSVMYVPEDAKVLELGGHVGRNSCVIASLLTDSRNQVTLEPCQAFARLLQENRDLNGLQFHIEVSALSKVPLIQKGWVTLPSDVVLPGYVSIKTIQFDELERKYEMQFDTLVADCEGALYYILRDDPDILKNIKLIVVENDFHDISQVEYVHQQFKQHGFEIVHSQSGGWGPCQGYFFQVWKK